jgi:ATP-binding cassette subfamily F protein 3
MALLSISDLTISFGANDILTGAGGEANPGDRIGLVGRNGAGKTSLLRVLAGIERPSRGERHTARWVRTVLVEQIPPTTDSTTTIRNEVLSAVQDVVLLGVELEEAAAAMADGDEDAAEHYANLLHRMEHEGAFTYENRFAQIMTGLGFSETDWDTPLSFLSGGQRSRVGLARALMDEPDILLMDEPTNHLDIQGLRWLEGFLSQWAGAVIVTSHDRYFLDKVATRIWHIDNRRMRVYAGNYTKSEELRAADLLRQAQEYERQQAEIEKHEAFIRKFGAGTRATQAQDRVRKLARMERIEAPNKDQRSVSFRLKAARSGEVVLRAENVVAGYDGTPILSAGDLELERRSRVALVGRNGSGKTTLLKTIARELPPVRGTLKLGANVEVAHYWQEAEGLDPSITVMEELLRSEPDIQTARDLAGRFLFSGDDVLKRVGSLSGGERSRLALAKLVCSGANLVLLDEPTNHLDIPSREALEEALDAFEGTLIFASHDRRLIDRLATRLWLVDDASMTQFEGTWEEYTTRTESIPTQPTEAPRPAETPRAVPGMSDYRRTRRLTEIETQIEAAEIELSTLGQAINEASATGNHQHIGNLGHRHEAVRTLLDNLMEEWAQLA